MSGRALLLAGAAASALACGALACDGGRQPEDPRREKPSAAVEAAAPSSPAASSTHAVVDARSLDVAGPRCKVMSSENGPGAATDATRWLDVPAKASFTVRTLESGRELRFEGPGRVRPCGDDVALVAEGAAVGLPGSGEAPGAEQWAATACGVARWASGVHRFSGARDTCKLQSSLGAVQLWLAADVAVEDVPIDAGAPQAPGAADASVNAAAGAAAGGLDVARGSAASPWLRIDAKRALHLHARARGTLDSPAAVKSALAACERSAANVQGLAMRMNDGGPATGNLGELAAESVTARGVARAACAVAAVRVSLAGSRADDQARLDAAIMGWRASR
jgi:hypothetical protein